jgi:hypothetical protein
MAIVAILQQLALHQL